MLENGTKVAGYEIEGILGHGGMGVVYEARQLALGRKVALKILAGTLGMDPSFKERFRNEGRIQAAIDHPHIVTVFEAGEWEDSLFIAMRLVRGPNLKEMIIARELEGARTLRILRPIAEALDAAHEAGLIHRDIKPQNILVGSRDRAYLADFGLTKGIDDAGLTQTGQFVGTIDYISPEQIRGETTTSACDIYALAAVLYECLTGAVPYPKPSDAAVMYAHLSEPPPLVTEQRPELPPNLDEVICKAMDKDPGARHAERQRDDRRGREGARQARARGDHAARPDRRARGGRHPRARGARPDPPGAPAPATRAGHDPRRHAPAVAAQAGPAHGGRTCGHGRPAARRRARGERAGHRRAGGAADRRRPRGRRRADRRRPAATVAPAVRPEEPVAEPPSPTMASPAVERTERTTSPHLRARGAGRRSADGGDAVRRRGARRRQPDVVPAPAVAGTPPPALPVRRARARARPLLALPVRDRGGRDRRRRADRLPDRQAR